MSIVINRCIQIKSLLQPLLLLLTLSGPPLHTQSLTFFLENDVVARTDRHYTHGCGFIWTSATDSLNWKLKNTGAPIINLAKRLHPTAMYSSRSIALRQFAYTPQNIKTHTLLKNDQPYAGATFLTARFSSKDALTVVTLAFDIGILGPDAGAAAMQKAVHRLIHSPAPQGWEHQLANELILNLHLGQLRLWKQGLWHEQMHWRLSHFAQGHFGSLLTGGTGGLSFTLGPDPPALWGASPWQPGTVITCPTQKTVPSWLLFCKTEVNLVLRNAYLDGNLLHPSHRVKRKPLIVRLQLGFITHWRGTVLAWHFTLEGRSFQTHRHAHRYGAVIITLPL